MTLVSEAMNRSPVIIGPEAELTEAAALLAATQAAHLLVVDEGNLVGILCRCDVRDTTPDERVADRMAVPVMTVRPDATLEEAALTMQDCGVGCVPVALGGLVLGTISAEELERAGLEPPAHRHCHDPGEASRAC
ncbi:CBS domain-containing protein [Anaeromyxobacter oryzisoli]|jgi:CBS domain-containing protein|uniref:CBS domain-containing protein n=1 Tax=Anaeromyxobacter oryzisoli TaxID=2925408 RepID=UPI001F5A03D1|nr:CBS domain-containing protein [Anaeromyxobacter sp. SG63]